MIQCLHGEMHWEEWHRCCDIVLGCYWPSEERLEGGSSTAGHPGSWRCDDVNSWMSGADHVDGWGHLFSHHGWPWATETAESETPQNRDYHIFKSSFLINLVISVVKSSWHFDHISMLRVLLICYQASWGTCPLVLHLSGGIQEHLQISLRVCQVRDSTLVPCQPHAVRLVNLCEPSSDVRTSRWEICKGWTGWAPPESIQVLWGSPELGRVWGPKVHLGALDATHVSCQHLSHSLNKPHPQPVMYREQQPFWSKNCIKSLRPFEEDMWPGPSEARWLFFFYYWSIKQY